MSQSNTSAVQQSASARAWVILAVTYLASFAGPLAQFRVPALANFIIPSVIVGPAGGDPVLVNTYFGLLMTALTIIGVVLAFPASYIAKKIGLKATVLISVACLFVGTALGLPDDFALLFAGRVLEGFGIGMIGVAGPSCIAVWFPGKSRGTAMGIWATWVPVAIIISFMIATPIAESPLGYHGLYYLCLAVDVVAFVLFAAVFKMPEHHEEIETVKFREGWKYLKSPQLILVCVMFFCYNFIQLGCISNFYATFLGENGYDPQSANAFVSFNYIVGTVVCIFGGFLFDKMKRKHLIWVVSFILLAISIVTSYLTGEWIAVAAWSFVFVFGISTGFLAGSLRPTASMLVPNTVLGATMAMGVLQFVQNLGGAIGSPLYGAAAAMYGYQASAYAIILPLCVLCIVMAVLYGTKSFQGKQDKLAAEWQAELSGGAAGDDAGASER